jgi:hypothetical protein
MNVARFYSLFGAVVSVLGGNQTEGLVHIKNSKGEFLFAEHFRAEHNSCPIHTDSSGLSKTPEHADLSVSWRPHDVETGELSDWVEFQFGWQMSLTGFNKKRKEAIIDWIATKMGWRPYLSSNNPLFSDFERASQYLPFHTETDAR